MLSVPRAVIPGLAALAIGIPVGFAAAQASDQAADVGQVPATKCPEAAQAIEAGGSDVDYFIPSCPAADAVDRQLAPAPTDDAIVDACREALEASTHPVCAAIVATAAEKQG